MTQFIDICVNLESFRDPRALAQQAHENDVSFVICCGNVAESKRGVSHAETLDTVTTAGVHPHHAKTHDDETISHLRRLAKHERVVAIGECGLDYNRNFSTPRQQRRSFAAQLSLAIEQQLPVYLHERDAFDDMLRMLQEVNEELVGGVIHCFTGDVSQMEQYLALGLHIGVTGWVCDERRGQSLQQAVPHIPDDRLLLETDAPYLLPRTIRPKPKSRTNTPANLRWVADKVAALRGVSVDSIAALTRANAQRLFGLRDE